MWRFTSLLALCIRSCDWARMVLFAIISTSRPSWPVTRMEPCTLLASRTFVPPPEEKARVRRMVSFSSILNRRWPSAVHPASIRASAESSKNDFFIDLLQFGQTLLRAFAHGAIEFFVLADLPQRGNRFLFTQVH